MRTIGYESYARWYPKGWRERYGDEFVARLEETYAGERVPLRATLSIVRAGTYERACELGVVGNSVDDDRALTGSALAVLMSWTVFVVAGLVFAKYVEHWQWVTPANEHTLPTVAYDAVATAAIVGAVIALSAALVTLPALIRLVRHQGWRTVATPFRRSIVAGLCALVFTTALVVTAHQMRGSRAASFWPDRVVFLLWFVVVVVAIFIGGASAAAVTRRVELTTRTTQTLGCLALAMNVVLLAIFAGVLTWWGAVAANAPWYFSSKILNAPASSSPNSFTVVGSMSHAEPVLLIVMSLAMLISLLVALHGAARITTRLRRAR